MHASLEGDLSGGKPPLVFELTTRSYTSSSSSLFLPGKKPASHFPSFPFSSSSIWTEEVFLSREPVARPNILAFHLYSPEGKTTKENHKQFFFPDPRKERFVVRSRKGDTRRTFRQEESKRKHPFLHQKAEDRTVVSFFPPVFFLRKWRKRTTINKRKHLGPPGRTNIVKREKSAYIFTTPRR